MVRLVWYTVSSVWCSWYGFHHTLSVQYGEPSIFHVFIYCHISMVSAVGSIMYPSLLWGQLISSIFLLVRWAQYLSPLHTFDLVWWAQYVKHLQCSNLPWYMWHVWELMVAHRWADCSPALTAEGKSMVGLFTHIHIAMFSLPDSLFCVLVDT